MKPLSLTISNFRSFTTSQVFHFPDSPGLYFMRGENKAESRLDANGSGKSSVWDALCWVLFGKTTRGLRAGDVSNWMVGKNTRVEFLYEVSGQQWKLIRNWKPNSWVLEDQAGEVTELAEDSANLALSHLACSFSPFLHCILMAQQQPMFLDLPATAKSSLFSEVLELEVWSDYSTKASKKATALAAELSALEVKLAREHSHLLTLSKIDNEAESREWDRKQEASLKEREEVYAQYVIKAKQAKADLTTAEAELKSLPDPSALQESIEALQTTERATSRRLVDEVELPRAKVDAQLRNVVAELEHIKSSGDTCRSCGQPLPKGKLDTTLDQLEAQLLSLTRELESLQEIERTIKDALIRTRSTLERRVKQAKDASKVRDLGVGKVNAFKRALDMAERELDRIEDEVGRLWSQTNPFLAIQKQRASEIAEVRGRVAVSEEKVRTLEEKLAIATYWVAGFKDIRLQLIDESLTQLEIEVNSALTSLGLIGWELRFDVDRETKSGSIKQGFNVQVVSPHNTQPVPWEAWSGGESQRLRLAAALGLSNLIRSHLGINMDVEVWDEPTQHMSGQGVEDLLEALKARAESEQRQIWIVDHRSLGFGGFSGEVTITKTSTGSTITGRSYGSVLDSGNGGISDFVRGVSVSSSTQHDRVQNSGGQRRALLRS